MKHRQVLMLLYIALPICVLLRTIQMCFTIDNTTGFLKQEYSAIGVSITVVICAAAAAIGLLATMVDTKKQSLCANGPCMAVACALVGGMFIYQTVAAFYAPIVDWYSVLLVLLSLWSAFVFIAYGIKSIYDCNMPRLMLAVPVAYYIMKLISIFVSTSKLALVTENVFLVLASSVLLWFMFEFASFENQVGDVDKKPKKLFALGLTATVMCAVTSLPKLFLLIFNKIQLSGAEISEALLNMSIGIFIMIYILRKFADSSENQKSVSKHSA